MRKIIVIFALILSYGCSMKNNDVNHLKEPVPVRVARAITKNYDIILTYVGTIEPYQKARIGAQMSGTIEKIYVREGDPVKKGQLLVQMNNQQLTQAKIQYELARSDYQRMKILFETGSISQQQFEKVKAGYESAKAAYELILANTQIRAPFDGIITDKLMNEGEVFSLMPTAGGGPGILVLMQIDKVKVRLSVSEKDFPSIKLNQPAEVTVDAYPDKIFKGKVSKIYPVSSSLTRTFFAEVEIENPDMLLRPGMFARVKIKVGEGRGVIIPESALLRLIGSNVHYVFTVSEGNSENTTVERRDVKLGRKFDGEVEVLKGVNDGELVVISGQTRLTDGAIVNIVKEK